MTVKKINHDDVSNFFEYNLHIPTRTIFLGSMSDLEGDESGVDYALAENFIKCMHVLETKTEEINIVMNNIGGDWYHGMAIYDIIKNSPCHIKLTVRGHAMSMGSIILQAADERIMSPHSRLMIHYGHNSLSGTMSESERWMDEYKKVKLIMEELYLKRIREKQPKFPRRKIRDMLAVDSIYNPEECVELGLADIILY